MRRTGEERKLVTIVFADLVGSTAYAGDRDPERVRAQLERFYGAMREEIELTGGTVEKFAGDAVMAVFGAPAALEDHAERALHSGLAMQERMGELFGGELELRVGVNTGEVVVGSTHEGSSFVTGDAVNVADRLQKAASPGEVLAGERTAAAAGAAFEFGEARVVDAKGKPRGVACRPVLAALELARPRGSGGMRRLFVGRESELDLLRATYRRAVVQREPHLVTIVGEAGVGKSRLVRELWGILDDEQPAPVRRIGRCLAYGDGITYWPLGDILKEHFGIHEDDPPEVVRQRLAGRELLALALGLDVAGEMHPLEARDRLHGAAVAFVQELAAETPAVFLVEDIHWAEDDLLDLLERIMREARGPILALATARPELLDRRPTWGAGRRNASSIWLEPLPVEAAGRLLDGLLSVELPPELRDLVVLRAEGNPFFLEELVGDLVEAGVLERRDGGWRARDIPEGFSVPDSVHAVLAARIDRLAPGDKAALQAAAVVGRVFWSGPVLHLVEEGGPDLELLEERDFIRRRPDSSLAFDQEYAFKHALTRDVAYSTIPKARRGRLHAAFAEWLARTGGGKDEQAALLAYHYSEAVKPEDADLVWADAHEELAQLRARAVHWLSRAAELAKRRSEFDEAIELLARAVELCDDPHRQALLWREVGLANALSFNGDAFWSAMEMALSGPLTDEERAEVYSMLAFQTSNRSGMWGVVTVPELVDRWVDSALELAAPDSEARIRALIARLNMDQLTHPNELEALGTLIHSSSDIELRSFALQVQASAAFSAGRFAEAESLVEERLELLPEIDDPDHLLDVYEAAFPTLMMRGRLEDARRLAALHEAAGVPLTPHHQIHSVAVFCDIEDAAGCWDAIAARVGEIVVAVENNLLTPCTRNSRSLLIAAFAVSATGGDPRRLEQRAAELAEEGWASSAYLSPRLRLALFRDDRAELERLLEADVFRVFVYGPSVMTAWLDAVTALRDAPRIEDIAPRYAQEGLFLEPFALRALGAARRDDDLLARADERFVALGLEWHRAQTEQLLAGLS